MNSSGPRRSHLTLALCTILHGFTHAYGAMFVPLYFRIAEDLKLSGVGAAALIVTLYGAVYNLGSYGAGLAADRYSRKTLLGIGLLGNAVAILAIGVSRQYWLILCFSVAAGIFGAIFHPAANALSSSHYPKSPGMAIGILGIGSGLGFFFGPQIAGWRARLRGLASMAHRPMAKALHRTGPRRPRRRNHLHARRHRCDKHNSLSPVHRPQIPF